MKKVVIIYDSSNPKKRRTCFWEKLKSRFDPNEFSFHFLSISELLVSGKNPATELFNKSKTDAIIINWDSINTDPVYGSDRAHDFFHHYIPDMDRWVRQGGVIIVEAQCASSRLVQSAYEPFTYDVSEMKQKYPVIVYRKEGVGNEVYKNNREKDHPLLKGIPDILNLEKAKLYLEGWFPEEYINGLPSLIDYQAFKKRLFAGWFTFYKNWEPLLFADKKRRRPTLLCRFVRGDGVVGAYVLTTMYLASSELTDLVKNALNLSTTGLQYLESLKTKQRRKTILATVFWIIAMIIGTITYFKGFPTILTTISSILTGAVGSVIADYIIKTTAKKPEEKR